MDKSPLSGDRFVPELALFDTEAERREVFRQFWRERWGRWGFALYCMVHSAVFFCLWGLLSLLVIVAVESLQSRGFRFPRWWRGFLTAMWMPCSLILGFYSTYPVRRQLRRHCRRRLAAKGVPICIACGYDLRGQVDPRCPECGTAFDPTLIKPQEGSSTG